MHCRHVIAVATALVLAAAAPAAADEVPFGSRTALSPTHSFAMAVTAADLDRDGAPDLVGVAQIAGDVTWWRGDGSGGFTEQVIASGLSLPSDAAVGDLDRDGDPDVVVALTGGDAVVWLENPPTDVVPWTAHTVATGLDGAKAAAIGDLDGDGDLDVVAAAVNAGVVTWYENADGSGGSFTAHTVTSSLSGAIGVDIGDADGDGTLDVLACGRAADAAEWFLNTAGDGSTWTARSLAALDGPHAVRAADMDRDGDLDAVVSYNLAGEVDWYENDAGDASSWTRHTVATGVNGPRGIDVADLDRDGSPDVIGAAELGDDVVWWANRGSSFNAHTVDDSFDGSYEVVAIDLDRDGDLDLAAAAINAGGVFATWSNQSLHRRALYRADGWASVDTLGSALRDPVLGEVVPTGIPEVVAASGDAVYSWRRDGGSWSRQTVANGLGSPYSPRLADLDGDGDLDVVAALRSGDAVSWWENLGGSTPTWSAGRQIATVDDPKSVAVGDLDGDGDVDVAVASGNGSASPGRIDWWANDGSGMGWALHAVFSSPVTAANWVGTADLDGDGRLDLLMSWGQSTGVAEMEWANDPGDGTWVGHLVGSDGIVHRALPADMDHDGDLDLVLLSSTGARLTWRENLNSYTGEWPDHVIDSTSAAGVHSGQVADLDQDGDLDVAVGGFGDGVRWFENEGASWSEHVVDASVQSLGLALADMSQWRLDLIGTSYDGDVGYWYDDGGQVGVALADVTGTALLARGERTPLVSVTLTHEGRAGDGDAELSTLRLRLMNEIGGSLTPAEADALFTDLTVHLDDGDGVFDPTRDLAVVTLTSFPLDVTGSLTVTLPDGADAAALPFGTPRTWFVSSALEPDAPLVDLRLLVSQVHTEDRAHDTPLYTSGDWSTETRLLEVMPPPPASGVSRPTAGTVVISAVTADDGDGPTYEWLEIQNISSGDLSLANCRVVFMADGCSVLERVELDDDGGCLASSDQCKTCPGGDCLVAGEGGHFLLASTTLAAPDVQYGGGDLLRELGAVRLECLGTVVDTVGWSADDACAETSVHLYTAHSLGSDATHRRVDRDSCAQDTDVNTSDFEWAVSPALTPYNRASPVRGCRPALVFSDDFELGNLDRWTRHLQ